MRSTCSQEPVAYLVVEMELKAWMQSFWFHSTFRFHIYVKVTHECTFMIGYIIIFSKLSKRRQHQTILHNVSLVLIMFLFETKLRPPPFKQNRTLSDHNNQFIINTDNHLIGVSDQKIMLSLSLYHYKQHFISMKWQTCCKDYSKSLVKVRQQ